MYKLSITIVSLICIFCAATASYGQNIDTPKVLPVYNVQYDEAQNLNVTVDVKWEGLSKIELREFINFDCAIGGYNQPKIISGGVITDVDARRIATIVPSNNAKRLKISYSVQSKYSDQNLSISDIESCNQGTPFVVGSEFFLIQARKLFPLIRYYSHTDEIINHKDRAIEIIWQLPNVWDVGHSIHEDGKIKSLFPKGIDYGQFLIGGKVRKETKTTDGTRRARSFSGASFTHHIAKIHNLVEKAHPYFTEKFWRPASYADNSLIIIPLISDFSNAIHGTAGNGQQIVFITANYDYGYNQWELDFAALHELFHTWNSIDLIHDSFFPYRHDVPKWLSEGVTDFVTYQYMADHYPNGAKYFQMGVNEALEFAATHNIEENPYAHGLLLALQHNAAQKDNIGKVAIYKSMRNLVTTVKAQTEKPYNQDDFSNIFFAPRISPFYNEKLLPQNIVIKNNIFELVKEALPEYDRGLELDYEYGGSGLAKVASIKVGGPAEKAGIDAGDIIINRIAGNSGDVHNKLIYRIQKADGTIKTIAYWPHGSKTPPPRLFYRAIK